MDTGIAFAGVNTRNEGVQVTGKLDMYGHPMVEHFKFVKAHTKQTPKITIPAPSAIYGRPVKTPIDKAVYPENDKLFDDLGKPIARQYARSPMPAADIFSSTRCSSPCCAIRNIVGR